DSNAVKRRPCNSPSLMKTTYCVEEPPRGVLRQLARPSKRMLKICSRFRRRLSRRTAVNTCFPPFFSNASNLRLWSCSTNDQKYSVSFLSHHAELVSGIFSMMSRSESFRFGNGGKSKKNQGRVEFLR